MLIASQSRGCDPPRYTSASERKGPGSVSDALLDACSCHRASFTTAFRFKLKYGKGDCALGSKLQTIEDARGYKAVIRTRPIEEICECEEQRTFRLVCRWFRFYKSWKCTSGFQTEQWSFDMRKASRIFLFAALLHSSCQANVVAYVSLPSEGHGKQIRCTFVSHGIWHMLCELPSNASTDPGPSDDLRARLISSLP